jgi:hypothetical protein
VEVDKRASASKTEAELLSKAHTNGTGVSICSVNNGAGDREQPGEAYMPMSERPRSEPEIIPPGHDHRKGTVRGRRGTFVFTDTSGTEYVRVTQIGPLSGLLSLLILGILSAVFLVLLIGTFLIWLPLVIAFLAGGIIVGAVRTYLRS